MTTLAATLSLPEAVLLVAALWGLRNAALNYRDARRDDRARVDWDEDHPELAPDVDLATTSRDFLERERLSTIKNGVLVVLAAGSCLLPPRAIPPGTPLWIAAWSQWVAPALLIVLAAALIYGSYRARRNRDAIYDSSRRKVQARKIAAAEAAAERAQGPGQPGGVET